MSILAGRWLFGLGVLLAIVASSFVYGHRVGAAGANARWQRDAAKQATEQAYARAKALDNAVERELARAADNEALEKKVSDYEAELARQPAPAAGFDCRLRPADLERLHLYQR